MKQYFDLKSKYPGAIMLFRVGDFYETFGEDAIKASEILGIVLTSRNNGSSAIELAGFPYHSVELYLPKLVRAGYKVAICEQLEKPSKDKAIVRRGITEVVTPGMALSDNILDSKTNNYLGSVMKENHIFGFSFIDISTGDFFCGQGDYELLNKQLNYFQPKEIICSKNILELIRSEINDCYITTLDEWIFQYDYNLEKLLNQFKVSSLKGFGISDFPIAICSAGAIIHYLNAHEKKDLAHINKLQYLHIDDCVWIDNFTVRNLELLSPQYKGGYSLFDVLNDTATPMATRLLWKWILQPSIDIYEITERLDIVEYFKTHSDIAKELHQNLQSFGDLERYVSKLATHKITPKEILHLKNSLIKINSLKNQYEVCTLSAIASWSKRLLQCEEIIEVIHATINSELNAGIGKGETIKTGISEELDEVRFLLHNGKDQILNIQKIEAENTGIQNLKIGFNNVFGYYLEVTNKYKDKGLIPDSWIRKQTLTNAERYVTEDLKILEEKILNAGAIVEELEIAIYTQLVAKIQNYIKHLQINFKLIAEIDVLCNFGRQALRYEYCRPSINQGLAIDLKASRHPVIERFLPADKSYIANDIYLLNDDIQLILITGPNMAGKSAILRQVALICIMAQMGSFVPAQVADIGYIDKIFTRVGASDNITGGESTFMVEMNETANILNNLSVRSLILLDEIGRGTSTYDGVSIAWSIAEFIHNHPLMPKALFATHYHELNELQTSHERIHNYHISSKEGKDNIMFLRKLVKGGSSHSYGIQVARMAGLPPEVIQRAYEILQLLQNKTDNLKDKPQTNNDKLKDAVPKSHKYQLSFFDEIPPDVLHINSVLKKIDINTLTPLECLLKLKELKDLANSIK